MDSPFEFETADMPIDDDSENGENSHPNVSNADHVTIRKRNGGIRGKAFRFAEHALASPILMALHMIR